MQVNSIFWRWPNGSGGSDDPGKPKTDNLRGLSLLREGAMRARHGIAYEEIGWPPGLHRILAKRCGAKHTTVPILLDGQDVIQGSGAIIDWAENKVRIAVEV